MPYPFKPDKALARVIASTSSFDSTNSRPSLLAARRVLFAILQTDSISLDHHHHHHRPRLATLHARPPLCGHLLCVAGLSSTLALQAVLLSVRRAERR